MKRAVQRSVVSLIALLLAIVGVWGASRNSLPIQSVRRAPSPQTTARATHRPERVESILRVSPWLEISPTANDGSPTSANLNNNLPKFDGSIAREAAGILPSSTGLEAIAAPTPINYVALGDSLAFGVGASAGNGYVPRYRTMLASDTGATVNLDNRGVSGTSSAQLLSAMQSDANLRIALQNAQVITFDIGAIDLLAARATYKQNMTSCGGADNQNCLRTAVANFKTNWDGIIAQLHSLNAGANVRTFDIYNPFVNVDKAADTFTNDGGLNDFQVFKVYLDQTNDHIHSTTEGNGIALGRVYCSFNGVNGDIDPGTFGLIAGDGFHPNDSGHAVIAERIRTGAAICLATPNPSPPVIFIEQGTMNTAVALDSVTFLRGPFKVVDDYNFSTDHHTRLILITSNVGLVQPNASILTAQAAGFDLPVENVGPVSGVAGFDASYIVVRLPDGLPSGDLSLTVTVNGNVSNTAILNISP